MYLKKGKKYAFVFLDARQFSNDYKEPIVREVQILFGHFSTE